MADLVDHNLVIDPSNELRFKGPFTTVVNRHLKLINHGSKTLCYKVKTTAPKMYCVRPNSGLIESGKDVDILIMLQPFDCVDNDKIKHKFLIQSVIADENHLENSEQLWKTVDRNMIKEIRLKCCFEQEQRTGDLIKEDEIVPSKNSSNNTQPGLGLTVEELRLQLSELKRENEKLKTAEERLRKIAQKDSRDSSMLSMDNVAKHSEANNIILLLVMCIIAFLVGITVSKFTL